MPASASTSVSLMLHAMFKPARDVEVSRAAIPLKLHGWDVATLGISLLELEIGYGMKWREPNTFAECHRLAKSVAAATPDNDPFSLYARQAERRDRGKDRWHRIAIISSRRTVANNVRLDSKGSRANRQSSHILLGYVSPNRLSDI